MNAPLNMVQVIRNGAVKGAVSQPAFKLVDEKIGKEITLPITRKCWDGYEITVHAFKPSQFKGNQGYIYTTTNETYVPSVIGAKIIEFPMTETDVLVCSESSP